MTKHSNPVDEEKSLFDTLTLRTIKTYTGLKLGLPKS